MLRTSSYTPNSERSQTLPQQNANVLYPHSTAQTSFIVENEGRAVGRLGVLMLQSRPDCQATEVTAWRALISGTVCDRLIADDQIVVGLPTVRIRVRISMRLYVPPGFRVLHGHNVICTSDELRVTAVIEATAERYGAH